MMGSDRQFAAAQLRHDNAEPPPDTRRCEVCEQQKDRGRVVEGRFICEGCLEADHRCTGCGQPLEERDGHGERCRYCSPDDFEKHLESLDD